MRKPPSVSSFYNFLKIRIYISSVQTLALVHTEAKIYIVNYTLSGFIQKLLHYYFLFVKPIEFKKLKFHLYWLAHKVKNWNWENFWMNPVKMWPRCGTSPVSQNSAFKKLLMTTSLLLFLTILFPQSRTSRRNALSPTYTWWTLVYSESLVPCTSDRHLTLRPVDCSSILQDKQEQLITGADLN